MSDEQPHRTTVIAGLRAMADFLETRPEIPLGDYAFVNVQHSVLHGTDDEKIAEVRRIASLLGVEARIYEDGSGIVCTYPVAELTTFTVHAILTPAAECTPECDALQADPTKATGLARGWHSDDCPVSVHHLAVDSVTKCGVPIAELPPAHGYTLSYDSDSVTCTACRTAYHRYYFGLEESAEHQAGEQA
jgi:hypothetical protein